MRTTIALALALPVMLAWLAGAPDVVANGMAAGSMITGGIFMFLARIPGFWWAAATNIGAIILAVLTGVATHLLVGGSAVTAIMAVGWSFMAKGMCLSIARTWRKALQ
jgi:apolipoprotein N-acyltransferase